MAGSAAGYSLEWKTVPPASYMIPLVTLTHLARTLPRKPPGYNSGQQQSLEAICPRVPTGSSDEQCYVESQLPGIPARKPIHLKLQRERAISTNSNYF